MHHTRKAKWMFALATAFAVAGPLQASTGQPPIPTPQFRSFGLHEGLPSSKVHAVAQDPAGFVWVGTYVGLSRFDGVEFTSPRLGSAAGQALPALAVTALLVDQAGRLWLGGPELGLARYDPSTGAFVHWRDGLTDGDIRALAQTPDGAIWAGTSHGVDRIRPDGSGLEHFAPGSAGLSSAVINALQVDDRGHLWVGGDHGVDIIDQEGKVTPATFTDATPPRVLHIDGKGADIVVSTDRGLYRRGIDGRLSRDLRMPATTLYASLADSHGTEWVASIDGLQLLDRHGRLHRVAGAWTAQGGLPGRSVKAMVEDREHGLWFALNDGGLGYLGPSWEDFSRFAHVATDARSLPGRTVTAVAARGASRLWVGGLRGWIRGFDPSTGQVDDAFDIGTSRVHALLETRAGDLLAGTSDGLARVSLRGRARPWLQGVIRRPVTAIVQAPAGNLFVAAMGEGVYALDAHAGHPVLLPFAGPHRGAGETRQLQWFDGELWQASAAGLARLHDDGTLRLVEGVAPGRVSAFEHAADGFWLVRPDALEHYTWQEGRASLTRSVSAARGFPSADILAIRRDIAGRLWLYGQTGAWRFDPRAGAFRPFGVADGLANGEFTSGATVRLADGTIYGGTLGGLVGFRPDRQRDHARRPTLAVLGASVLRDGVRRELPVVDGALSMGWQDRGLTLRARALSFVNPARNRVAFALEHHGNSTLVRADAAGDGHFPPLAAGRYRVDVTGAGGDGVDGSLAGPLWLVVQPPPWLRWWAWLLYTVAGLGIVAATVHATRHRMRQAMRVTLAEQKRQLAEAASAAKTDFMATLGHEIRTPMTGVLGMAELIARSPLNDHQRAWIDAVRRSGATLLRLVNDALDITRIEARRLVLEPERVACRTLAAEVIELAAAHARDKGLALTLRVADDVPAYVMADPVRLRQILQNLVNNAVKFTEQGGVAVHVEAQDDTVVIKVRDTGPGMAPELVGRVFSRFEQGGTRQRHEGTGLGLAICHELCSLMGGGIAVESQPGIGSTFTASLPLPACEPPAPAATSSDAMLVPGGCHALLVEDDPVVAEVIAGLVRQRGHAVDVVTDGLAALTCMAGRAYDVVLLDLDLPVMDGFRVAGMIRRSGTHARVPIIAVTARSAGDEAEAVRAAGMDALLRKPMTGDSLDQALAAVSQTA